MISFIYIDLGGVVFDDFSGNNKWQALLAELGISADNSAQFEKIWKQYFPEICIDRDIESLVPIFRKELNLNLPDDYKLMDGFVNRFYANPLIWPLLYKMKKNYRVGVLSNLYPGMYKAIERRHILPEIDWDIFIDSSVEKIQKPDVRIFELAQKKAGVPTSNILFIDNTKKHVDAALRCGWQTFLYNSADHESSTNFLEQYLTQL